MQSLFIPSCTNDLLRFCYDYTVADAQSLQELSFVASTITDSCDSAYSVSSPSLSTLSSPSSTCSGSEKEWNYDHKFSFSREINPAQSSWKYTCSVCRKLFERPSTLRTHMNSHTGERPFACLNKSCKRSFTVRSNMMRHHKKCTKH
jgi:hypothetical protein